MIRGILFLFICSLAYSQVFPVGAVLGGSSGGSGGIAGLAVNGDGSISASKALLDAACSQPSFTSGGTTTIDWSLSNCAVVIASGGNTTLSFTNTHGSGPYLLVLTTDSTVRTWAFPGAASGQCSPGAINVTTYQNFFIDQNSNYIFLGCVSNETAPIVRFSGTRAAPLQSTCTAGCFWADSTDNALEYYQASGSPQATFLKGVDCNPITGRCNNLLTFGTASNCTSSTSPAVCGAAPTGAIVIAAAATTVTVNTTAVTANSNIILTENSALSTRLSVTCNTQSSLILGNPKITTITAATSFVITLDVAPTANPYCLTYEIIN